jgi:signal transduction histidine kinase
MGEKKMNFMKYDICDNAATVLISLEKRINDKMLDVSFDAEEDRLYVSADADAMYRVLYNLIENAVKYTPQGWVLVNVSADNDNVYISVRDTGMGMPSEELPHIFQKFYRIDNRDTREIGGTGLGLYLVKQRVEAMNGRIWAESEVGKGSTFFVSFPRMDEASYQQAKFVHDNTMQQRQNMMLEN